MVNKIPFIYYYITFNKYSKARGFLKMALPFYSQVSKAATGLLKGAMPKAAGTVFDLLDPANARRAISGLLPGGKSSNSKTDPTIGFQNQSGTGGATAAGEDDWRVRLSLPDNSQLFYKNGGSSSTQNALMAPLMETNGVIWPYTPSVTISHVANYNPVQLTHSNYSAQFYNNSDVADITIAGEFTVQSVEEGQYLMAAIYFLRSATKMFFGQGANVGNPPPILFLDGYGSHYFPHVPVVVTNFTHTMRDDVDYLQIPISTTTLEETLITEPDNQNIGSVQLSTEEQQYVPSLLKGNPEARQNRYKSEYKTITSTSRVPTSSSISVTLRPMYSRKNLHDRFNLDDFATGKLIADKDKGFGGFL